MEKDYVNDFDKTFLELTKISQKFGESKLETYVSGIADQYLGGNESTREKSSYRISLLEGALRVIQKKSTRVKEANQIALTYSKKKSCFSTYMDSQNKDLVKMIGGSILGLGVFVGAAFYLGPSIMRGANGFMTPLRFANQIIKQKPIESYNLTKRNNLNVASSRNVENTQSIPEKELDKMIKQTVDKSTRTIPTDLQDQSCEYNANMGNGETLEQFADRYYEPCNFPKKDRQLLKEYVSEIARCNINANGSLGRLQGPMLIKFPCTEIEYLKEEQEKN